MVFFTRNPHRPPSIQRRFFLVKNLQKFLVHSEWTRILHSQRLSRGTLPPRSLRPRVGPLPVSFLEQNSLNKSLGGFIGPLDLLSRVVRRQKTSLKSPLRYPNVPSPLRRYPKMSGEWCPSSTSVGGTPIYLTVLTTGNSSRLLSLSYRWVLTTNKGRTTDPT